MRGVFFPAAIAVLRARPAVECGHADGAPTADSGVIYAAHAAGPAMRFATGTAPAGVAVSDLNGVDDLGREATTGAQQVRRP